MADTPKEQCFKEAMEDYEKATGDKLGMKWKQPWYREMGPNGPVWKQGDPNKGFGSWIGSIKKTLGIRNGTGDARPPGAANPDQLRYPDMTTGDGQAPDLKFTNKDGGIDPDGTRPGMSGTSQKEDYNQINGRKKDDPMLALNKESCECAKRGAQQKEVEVPSSSMSQFGVPGVNPINPRMPSFPGVRIPSFGGGGFGGGVLVPP